MNNVYKSFSTIALRNPTGKYLGITADMVTVITAPATKLLWKKIGILNTHTQLPKYAIF